MKLQLINSRWLLTNNGNKPEPYNELPNNLKLVFQEELKKEIKKHHANIELQKILRHSFLIADIVSKKYNSSLLDRIKRKIQYLIYTQQLNDTRNKRISYTNWISNLI